MKSLTAAMLVVLGAACGGGSSPAAESAEFMESAGVLPTTPGTSNPEFHGWAWGDEGGWQSQPDNAVWSGIDLFAWGTKIWDNGNWNTAAWPKGWGPDMSTCGYITNPLGHGGTVTRCRFYCMTNVADCDQAGTPPG